MQKEEAEIKTDETNRKRDKILRIDMFVVARRN